MKHLRLVDISRSFSKHKVLTNISFQCKAGETLVIMGASGSGKTTLLRLIAKLLEPNTGRILFDDDDLHSVSYMPQGESLFPWLTVAENVLMPLRIGRMKRDISETDLMHVRAMLSDFGIPGILHMRPAELSGGMRQRVALIRSLLTKPEVLLLDEPFSALDEVVRSRIEIDVTKYVRQNSISCLFVTHSVDQALAMGDRIALLAGEPSQLTELCSISEADRPLSPDRYGQLRASILESIYANS